MNEITIPIYTLRGKQIMLDSDLAELYQVETRVLNQAVKRNVDRFPADFMFQLSEEEYESLRSQFVTLDNILDALVFETKKTDEKVMGFLKP